MHHMFTPFIYFSPFFPPFCNMVLHLLMKNSGSDCWHIQAKQTLDKITDFSCIGLSIVICLLSCFLNIYFLTCSKLELVILGLIVTVMKECVPLQNHMLKLYPQCDDIKRWVLWELIKIWWGHEGGTLINWVNALIGVIQSLPPFSVLCHVRI